MKVIIVGGVAGGASCAARLRRLDENAEIIMVERGPYVSYANCGLPYHVGGVIEKESSLMVADENTFRSQFAIDVQNRLRGDRHLAAAQDRRAAQCRHRRGEHRVLRQAGAVARRAVDPPTAARHRPAGDLRSPDGAGRTRDPRVDRTRLCLPRRDAPVLRLPDRAAEDPRGGGGRRLHRPGNRGKPHPPRLRRDPGRDGQPDPGADRPRDGAHRRRLPRAPWPAPGAQRRRGRLRAGRERLAEGAHPVRQGACGRHRDPCPGRAPGHRAGQGGRAGDRRSAAASGSTSTCAPATRTSWPWATRSRSATSSPASGAWSRWPARRTGRAASRPTSSPGACRASAVRKAPRSSASSAEWRPGLAPARRH